MLTAVNGSPTISVAANSCESTTRFRNLELRYDQPNGVLWKFLASDSTPYFSHEQLSDIRVVQSAISDGTSLELPDYEVEGLKFIVFGSKIPKIFNLGGDLQLFRDLIARRDRTGLQFYAKKATDAIFHHAANSRNVLTLSLVQGSAMGGGFEAALAGNVLVAERGTRLGFPEVLFGLFPGMGAYTLLRRRVDTLTAEKIILSAKNYPAEELHAMGIIDILADPGKGEHEIYTYISRQKSRPGATAFRKALNRARVIDHDELYTISDEWVDAAMELPLQYLRRIDRLISNQRKEYIHPNLRSIGTVEV